MTRLAFSALTASFDTLINDNTTGEISPADVRQALNNIADTFQPSDIALVGLPPATVPLTTTFTKLNVFNAVSSVVVGSAATDYAPSVANSDIVVNALNGIHDVAFTAAVAGPNNDDLVVAFFVGGVEQVQKVETALRGPGNNVELSFSFPVVVTGAPVAIDVRARLKAGSASVTFSESLLIVRYLPGQ
jgi:hypothetical protein